MKPRAVIVQLRALYLLVAALCIAAPTPAGDFAEAATALKSIQKSMDPILGSPEYVRVYEEKFGDGLDSAYLRGLSPAQRSELIGFAAVASYMGEEPRYAYQMLLIAETLVEEGKAADHDVQLTYAELMRFRKFEHAYDFARRAGLDAPKFSIVDRTSQDRRHPTLLYLSDTPHELERRELDLNSGPRIIVLSAPGCGFCMKAAKVLSSDDAVGRVFAAHSEWVEPTYSGLQYDGLLSWRQRFPRLRVSAMYDFGEWPAWMKTEMNAVPTFYFFSDGELKEMMMGWPDDAEHRVRDALEKMNLPLD